MTSISFSIECDYSIHEQLKDDLQPVTDGEIVIVEKRNLDGTSAILEIMQIIASLASAVTPLIALYLDNRNKNKVKKIKFEDIEIENPTAEQWQTIWNDYLSRRNDKK